MSSDGAETAVATTQVAESESTRAGVDLATRPGEEQPRSVRGGPWWWLARRTAVGLLTLVIVSIIVFVATQALPTDPARAILGKDATPASVAALRHELGLNRPLLSQYWSWATGVLHGDLGTSLAAREPVATLIGDRLEASSILVACSAAVIVPLALLLGCWCAVRRNRVEDHAASVISLVLNALPEFVVGMFLVILLSTSVFHLLPAVSVFTPGDSPLKHPSAIALPLLTLVIVSVPYLFRLVRASMIEALDSDYVEAARLRGLSETTLVIRHALPNSLVPLIQGVAVNLAYLAGGIVVVEFLFRYPGVGSGFVDAMSNRDLPTIQAIVLVLAAFYVAVNLFADFLTVLASPRLRSADRHERHGQ
jgi:peptide/nickel transport system permease protein